LYKIPARTLFFGKNLLILPECPSTNTRAAELDQEGQAPDGTVVITHHQTSGRGQRGNTWESGMGLNLTFSIVVRPVFLTAASQFHLNKAVALAVHDVVSKYTSERVRVKWPNDIMIGAKKVCGKVCGILIENQLTGSQLSRAIIGIGLNVNQREFTSPLASSVSAHSGKAIELPTIFEELLQSVEWRYLQIKGNHLSEIDSHYLRSLYRANEMHRFTVDNQERRGTIRGVDENGRLLVEFDNGIRSFDLKEIKYVH
jgi:BirA family transcriptional regulator, biotin operon repressor / biotin---[acetyl-CoA-carboxylase] ligase